MGLDEAHEMLINKDCKQAVVHPTKEFVSRQSLYFPFRSSVLHNIRRQLVLRADCDHQSSELATKTRNKKAIENAKAMKEFISSSDIFSSSNASLRNAFTGKIASPAQQEDLLKFRDIGTSDFDTFVKHVYLCDSSVEPVARQHRLKTFATTKITKRLVNNLQKEKNLVTKCLRSRLLWAQVHGETDESPEQHYLELPRAIATENGIPNKGSKANTTAFYIKRYEDKAILTRFPLGWRPDVVILA